MTRLDYLCSFYCPNQILCAKKQVESVVSVIDAANNMNSD